jgi:hypothetical protein
VKKYESPKIEIQVPVEQVYQHLSSFNGFGKMMPEQIINWQSDETHCSFTISGMADIEMEYEQRIPHEIIRMKSTKSPFDFFINTLLKKTSEKSCESSVIIEADINSMIAMMAGNALQNLSVIINEKIKTICENEY